MSAFKNVWDSARASLSRSATPVTATSTPPPPEEKKVEVPKVDVDVKGPAPLEKLFTKVDPVVDGEDCLRDCESCTVRYPRKFEVEEEDKLYGHIAGWATHVLVATGKTDWVHTIEEEKGSIMEAFGKAWADGVWPTNGVSPYVGGLLNTARKKLFPGRWANDGTQKLMLSATNIPTPTHHNDYNEPTSIILLPSFTIVENVTPAKVPELITNIIEVGPTNTQLLEPGSIPRSLPDVFPTASEMTARPSPHRALILLCSHRTRDARCGQSAPLLRKELERHLRPLGLFRDLDDEREGGVGIYFINHVGGHKYSANMMVYRRPNAFGLDEVKRAEVGDDVHPNAAPIETDLEKEGAGQCIWLARIRPEDCENIVRYTVLQGKVVKPERQLRGGFDRQKGVFSW